MYGISDGDWIFMLIIVGVIGGGRNRSGAVGFLSPDLGVELSAQ
jgi:hypothetical protein